MSPNPQKVEFEALTRALVDRLNSGGSLDGKISCEILSTYTGSPGEVMVGANYDFLGKLASDTFPYEGEKDSSPLQIAIRLLGHRLGSHRIEVPELDKKLEELKERVRQNPQDERLAQILEEATSDIYSLISSTEMSLEVRAVVGNIDALRYESRKKFLAQADELMSSGDLYDKFQLLEKYCPRKMEAEGISQMRGNELEEAFAKIHVEIASEVEKYEAEHGAGSE